MFLEDFLGPRFLDNKNVVSVNSPMFLQGFLRRKFPSPVQWWSWLLPICKLYFGYNFDWKIYLIFYINRGVSRQNTSQERLPSYPCLFGPAGALPKILCSIFRRIFAAFLGPNMWKIMLEMLSEFRSPTFVKEFTPPSLLEDCVTIRSPIFLRLSS